MHTLTAATIDGRTYELGKRCRHPFLDRTDGAVVVAVDTSSSKGCTPVIDVTFDDDTKITTTLNGVVLCWQPTTGTTPRGKTPATRPSHKKKKRRSAT